MKIHDLTESAIEALVSGTVLSALLSGLSVYNPKLSAWLGFVCVVAGLVSLYVLYRKDLTVYGSVTAGMTLIFGLAIAFASTDTLIYMIEGLLILEAIALVIIEILSQIADALGL